VIGRDRQRGIILIAVLWSIALLSGLAMAASTTFRSFAGIVTVHRDRLRADALFTAGLEVAAGIIGRLDATPVVELETRLAMPGGGVQIRLGDEGGRIDIGKAPVELLASLFRHLGARYPDVIAQQIAAWRTVDKDQPRAATSEEAQSPESECRSAMFGNCRRSPACRRSCSRRRPRC
jgi:general secretion pathway protein K